MPETVTSPERTYISVTTRKWYTPGSRHPGGISTRPVDAFASGSKLRSLMPTAVSGPTVGPISACWNGSSWCWMNSMCGLDTSPLPVVRRLRLRLGSTLLHRGQDLLHERVVPPLEPDRGLVHVAGPHDR